jgi:hypothetical protein
MLVMFLSLLCHMCFKLMLLGVGGKNTLGGALAGETNLLYGLGPPPPLV